MSGTNDFSKTRRDLLQAVAATGAATAILGGMGINPALAAEAVGRSEKPLKAAFSNAGLQATWCAQGKQAAEFWGKLFNVEVTWFDGQLDAVKQRAAIDNMASQKWDFVAIQAFGIAGYSHEEVEQRFGGMLNAFKYGAPPHGGAAPGVDRIVMLLADEPNIREVITFPMNQQAVDLMMDAPTELPPEKLRELHIAVRLPPTK